MTTPALRWGSRAALGRPRLIAALWLWNALLGLVIGWGVSRWLGAAFDYSPEADRALRHFSFGLLAELVQYDRFSPPTFAGGAATGLIAIAAISNALVAAGILEVLTTEDTRPLLHRFLRGGGHFFGRFLRLLIVTGLALVLGWTIVGAITSPIVRAIGESSWERTWLLASILRLAVLGLVVALAMAILDVARTQVVISATEQRGMLRAWLRGARATFAHGWPLAGVYVVLGIAWLACAAIGLAIVFAVTPTNWAAIGLLILVQQGFVFARGGLRVARAGAVLQVVRTAMNTGAKAAVAAAAGPKAGGPTCEGSPDAVAESTGPTALP